MKDMVWDDVLSVGVDEVDDDHKKLADLANLLNHAVTEGGSAEYIGAILEELIKFAAWHFCHEERLMLMYQYPGAEDHKTEHRELIESAKELQQKFIQTGSLDEKEDLEFIEQWITEHILVADMKMGSYLVEVM